MRRLKISIVCFLLCFFTASMAFATELNIPFRRQTTPVWCWAATIAMVVDYVTGANTQDCEVLSRYDRSLGGPGTCCMGDARCIRTGQDHEMVRIMQLYNIHGNYIPRPPSFQGNQAFHR
jgi:hypothetical protein